MLTNELITELVDRYQLERQRLIQLDRDILVRLVNNFRLNGFNQAELENALNNPPNNPGPIGGSKIRKSKKRTSYKHRSNQNIRYK